MLQFYLITYLDTNNLWNISSKDEKTERAQDHVDYARGEDLVLAQENDYCLVVRDFQGRDAELQDSSLDR